MTALGLMEVDWAWIVRNADNIWSRTEEQVVLSVLPVVFGLLIAFPLGLLSIRIPRLYEPLIGITGVLFTIPSLALFVLLIPFTGLGRTSAIVALTIYTLLILLRNIVEGLRGVPMDVREAAEAMGYRRTRQLFQVELPLAVPVIFAGVRIATVTSIGLVTVSALIGAGGYGQFFIDGYLRRFATPMLVGLALSVLLAIAADLGLLGLQRVLTPWTRRAD